LQIKIYCGTQNWKFGFTAVERACKAWHFHVARTSKGGPKITEIKEEEDG
jgi:hypothetical protein